MGSLRKGLLVGAVALGMLVAPAGASARPTLAWNDHPRTLLDANLAVLPPNAVAHRVSKRDNAYYSLKRVGEAEQVAVDGAEAWYSANVGSTAGAFSAGDVRSTLVSTTPANLWNVHVHIYTVAGSGGTDCDFNYTITPILTMPRAFEMQRQGTPVCSAF